jgi:hypothetical protein
VWGAAATGTATLAALRWREDWTLRHSPVPVPVPAVGTVSGFALGGAAVGLAGRAVVMFEARGSSAAPLLRRLDRASRAMGAVVARLGDGAADTRRESADAARLLREAASRLVAVERAAAVAPADARRRLDESSLRLRTGLADGVAAYERLVGAAAECVAAAHDGEEVAVATRLADATDRLRGLAAGVAETVRITAAVLSPR